MRRRMTDAVCRCGHPFVSHEHLRQGTDCAWCEPGTCLRFRTPSFRERLRERLRDRTDPGGSGTSSRSAGLVLVR